MHRLGKLRASRRWAEFEARSPSFLLAPRSAVPEAPTAAGALWRADGVGVCLAAALLTSASTAALEPLVRARRQVGDELHSSMVCHSSLLS